MKKHRTNRSLPHYHSELAYTAAALGADPNAVTLSPLCGQLIAEWFQVEKTIRDANLEVVRAKAVVRVKNQILDRTTRKFAGILLAEASHDRDSSLFRRFFRVAPHIQRNQPLSKQIGHTQHVLVREIEKLDENHVLKPYGGMLRGTASEADAALKNLESAKAACLAVSRDVETWKEKVNAARLSIYGDLLKLAAENQYPRKWADTFFRTRPRQNSRSTNGDATAETMTPVSTGADTSDTHAA